MTFMLNLWIKIFEKWKICEAVLCRSEWTDPSYFGLNVFSLKNPPNEAWKLLEQLG